jgi:hypothetical protein
MQPKVVESERNVDIAENIAKASVKKSEGERASVINAAEGKAEATKLNAAADSEAISKVGTAEAAVILAKGKSTGEAYELQVKAMGEQNFGMIKVIENIAEKGVKLIPETLVLGGGGDGAGSMISNFIGLGMLEKVTGMSYAEMIKKQSAKVDQ